jgi:hypothetical protein
MMSMHEEADLTAPAVIPVNDGQGRYRMLVLTRRLKLPGLLETMTDQAPEVQRVMGKIERDLAQSIASLEGGEWMVVSHSVTIHNGLVIASFLLTR